MMNYEKRNRRVLHSIYFGSPVIFIFLTRSNQALYRLAVEVWENESFLYGIKSHSFRIHICAYIYLFMWEGLINNAFFSTDDRETIRGQATFFVLGTGIFSHHLPFKIKILNIKKLQLENSREKLNYLHFSCFQEYH